MKNLTLFLIVAVIIIVAIIGFTSIYYYKNHQKEIAKCMEKCFYTPAKNDINTTTSLSRYAGDKGDYWNYETKKFETQKQCIDHCLTK